MVGSSEIVDFTLIVCDLIQNWTARLVCNQIYMKTLKKLVDIYVYNHSFCLCVGNIYTIIQSFGNSIVIYIYIYFFY